MGEYRSLKVWQRAHALTLRVYKVTRSYPSDELYGLTSQTRRSAASISANIAEGCGRNTDGELIRFCRIAMGSANELDYHLLLAHDLEYLDDDTYQRLGREIGQVRSMLASLIKSVLPD
jgi:four helix bundle protein